MTLDALRDLALTLPDTTEQPHHQMSSFRVQGRIFATVPPEGTRVHVMLDDADVDAAIAATPGAQALWWGKKRAGVRVELAEADPGQLGELLEQAWARRARK